MLADFLDRLSESSDPAEMAVYSIFTDMKGRRGLDAAIEDVDDGVMVNMIEGWIEVVRNGPRS
jgi:hypothetical protein